MNPEIASILYDEGIYILKKEDLNSEKKNLDLKGNPNSSVLCLFIKDDFSHPHDEELMLAEKIMEAIKVDNESYCWAYSKNAFENHGFTYSHVFLFHGGTLLSESEFPFNSWIKKNNSKALRTYSLSDLISDREKKKALWAELLKILE